jgi:tetratricopeptide (TPR) repeat protein
MRPAAVLALMIGCTASSPPRLEPAPIGNAVVEEERPPELPQELSERARHSYMAASGAFERGDYERAAAMFEAAYAELPQPATLYMLGRAYLHNGDTERAVVAFRSYLELEGSGVPADTREELETLIQNLSARP